MALFELQVFVDDGDGEARWTGEQGVDAVLLQGGNDESFLVLELLGDGVLVIVFGGDSVRLLVFWLMMAVVG